MKITSDDLTGVPGLTISELTNDIGNNLALDFIPEMPDGREPALILTVGNKQKAAGIILTATEVSALVEILNELTTLGIVV